MTLAQINVGDELTWTHESRGGYGYITPVDALVVKTGPVRVKVEVRLKSGEKVQRWVTPACLRARAATVRA